MRRRLVVVSLALLITATACREAKVARYRVPKEKVPEPAPAAADTSAMAATAVPTADGADLTWTAPATWTPKPAGAMRKGSYTVAGDNGAEADVSVTAFPGDVGGELANLNRWRGQIQLPPLAEAELAGAVLRSERQGLSFAVVDFANPAGARPVRVVGAIVPFRGATWFFKLTGPDALVAREKPAFLAFLETVRAPAPASP